MTGTEQVAHATEPVYKRRGIRRLATAMLAVVALSLTACASTGGAGQAEPDTQKLTLALDSTPILNYTQTGMSGTVSWVWSSIYDTLLKVEPDGSVSPNAAESFEVSEDATTTTLTLREGMTFTDGSPVDASAVKASIENIRDAGGPDSGRLAGVEVEAVDDSTIALHSPQPNGLMPMYMAVQLGAIANPAFFDGADADTNPQGSGPYVLNAEKTTSGSIYVLDRNVDYWNKDAYPYEQLELRVLEDETARISALRTGQIDGATVAPTSVNQFAEDQFNRITSNSTIEGLFIFDRTGEKVPALGDARVRQAMNMVWDRDSIVKNLYGGEAITTSEPYQAENDLYDPALEELYPYDIEGARKLMAEAGYADGFDLTIPSIPGFNKSNPMVVQQLGEIGIRVTEEDLPITSFFTEVLGGKYAVISLGIESRSALWDLANIVHRGSVWNIFHTGSDELDALVLAAQSATGDEADEIFDRVSEIVMEEAWFAPWAAPTAYLVTAKDVTATPIAGSSYPFLYTFAPAD
ncbi:ABC transporter substrate-binding protein [Microbacterium saperdae]|uniref:Peptide/nickel transport system substrate-binding protein n=1 Tax=Microbacterium saperdae TaxID=69368 RepID=A0A543BL61_9MICO|nr:ABC transporter substrate-binding protein [Microbacterium saperdae]TQL85556.1 peptide/nickel transport system substrate-binding protein [Microbacterium saperdae]GGM62835.1 peptide ABC transporter substrate-binding protein [Microbacterium saperdae]